jgi:hypothetical protein
MKKQTNNTPPKIQSVLNCWVAVARYGPAVAARLGKPKGELTVIARMEAEWSEIPNTLYEDTAGHLWLAFTKDRMRCEIDKQRGFEDVNVEMALDWMIHTLEFCDGWDGDPADICRIALAELARRPTPRHARKGRKELP